ncbi:trafficking kinesin-binding protein 2 isoform X2 [Lissotriton helveticus]
MNFSQLDSEVISDVCANENLPEVELVSLLEDQLPQYKLRVDSLFLYDHQDWIQSPSQKNHAVGSLSPVLAEETFRYMILGSDRVEQMTKTYNDIDMVTHLLAERDRDLELAARIGQALLKRNHSLAEQNESLEEQLAHALDQVNQLQHELSKKDDLLRVVSIASEESETDSSCSTPLRSNDSFNVSQGLLQLDNLQSKLRELEDENFTLRSQACHLKTETITYEEKEQQLVMDCVNEIRESNAEIIRLSEELSEKNDELIRYHEEISTLLTQIVDLQHKLKEYAIEKEELKLHLQASKEAQRQLTTELHELQDRNAECLGMLHESQEEVKLLRSKSSPIGQLRRPQSCSVIPVDSLAAEIEGTMRKELSLDEECLSPSQRGLHKRVFDTVKVANDSTRCRSASYPPPLPIPGSNRSCVMTAKPFESGLKPSEKGNGIIHCNLKEQATTKNEEVQSKDAPKLGKPGVPWAQDIAMALHRLSLRRQNYLSERQFFVDEWERQQTVMEDEKEDCSGCSTPNGSVLSIATYHSELTDFSATSSCLRSLLPEKLQIVKPLEGSQTLHQWQQLAQPNLGTLLDPRPGVVTKGFTPLAEDAVYHLCDLEEDEEDEKDEGITFQVQDHCLEDQKPPMPKATASIFLPPSTTASVPVTASNPGKCLSSTNSTFTFTNCRILHPSDITQVTPSFPEQKNGSRKQGRCSLCSLPFSAAPPCSCWRSGRHGPPKSCPPVRPRFRVSGMNLDYRSLSRSASQGVSEHLVISPGYCMTRCKEKIAVTLDQDFFGCFANEARISPCPTRLEVKSELEDTVNDLQEQISKLITLLEQERREHRETQKRLKTLHNDLTQELQLKCNAEVRLLQEAHAAELQATEERWNSALEELQAKMDQKIAELKDDYEHLQISFRAYKASLLEDMEERWRKREARWKAIHKEEKDKALLQQSISLRKAVEKEKNDVWLNAQKLIATTHQKHSEDMESLMKKYEGAQEAIQVQQKEAAELEIAKKQEELEAVNNLVREGQLEIAKLKMDLLDTQKDCAAKLKQGEAQHKKAMHAALHVNTELRHKLTVKREVPTDPYVEANQSASFDDQPCED